MVQNDIDFVIPWVDGADPEWIASYNRYSDQEDKRFNRNGERYRDWGLLRYLFRSIETYAPWVRQIHFVTCGQLPSWLNINHPKLHWVRHEDYLPARYLPTFSSRPIELNFHRIEGLSEMFVYFNDDMYLCAPTKPSDFFKNGHPRDLGIRSFPLLYEQGYIVLNDINLINRHLNFHALYHKNLSKWFNVRYGVHGLRNFIFFPYKDFTGVKNHHLPYTLLKSTYEDVWSHCGDVLEETSLRKFRDIRDVNLWLMRYWQLVTGTFTPQCVHFGQYFAGDDVKAIEKAITRKRLKVICLGDDGYQDASSYMSTLQKVFESVFPERSAYELY